MADHQTTQLLESVKVITLELSARALATDWSDPEQVSHADRLMRVLYSYGRNIEKCLAMSEKYHRNETAVDETADIKRLRDELERRLVRYAARLGKEELARRVAERDCLADDPRLGILVPPGSTSSED